jgi:hypothetical protein
MRIVVPPDKGTSVEGNGLKKPPNIGERHKVRIKKLPNGKNTEQIGEKYVQNIV